ncbi:xanthine dehydrogenase family protein subunit M [Candidatus Aerophobetes bacterium]|nr:xanthine dehydrogenase family protein subunit M [Candidatus Aerophobetes bacterium]
MLTRLKKFDYLKPPTLGEALEILERYDGQVKVLAGGTDLFVGMKEKEISPKYVLDIKGTGELNYITYDSREGLKIGALTSIRTVEISSLIKEHFPFLSSAAGALGSLQVRNKATMGGNLCNAAPSAETAPALLCLDARVKIVSLRGERVILLKDFFQGPGMTTLEREILVEIQIPPLKRKGIYIKHSPRRAMDIAVVGAAVAVNEDSEGRWHEVRIALGAVAPVPLRAQRAERVLEGKRVDMQLIKEAARLAQKEASPISDVRASAEYRREMVQVLVQRALQSIAGCEFVELEEDV